MAHYPARAAFVLSLLGFATNSPADEIRLLAEVGQPAPGLTGVQFQTVEPPAINDAGQVAFFARLSGTGVTTANDTSVWLGEISDPSTLRLVAREGMTAPGTEAGTVFGNLGRTSSVAAPILNDLGEVAFEVTLVGSAVTSANARGIWAATASSIRKIIRLGELAPNAAGNVRIAGFFDWVYSNGGVAAIVSLIGAGVVSDSDGIINSSAVVSGAPGSLNAVFAGAVIPAAPWPRGKIIGSFGRPTINNAGQVAFRATVEDFQVGGNPNAVIRVSGGAFAMVAYSGQPSPVTNYVVGPFVSGANARYPFIAADGGISFFSSLRCASGATCPTTSLESVLIVTPGGALQTAALENQPVSGTSAQFASFWEYPYAAAGGVALRGWLKGAVTSDTDDFIGLGTPGSAQVIARGGDAAAGTVNRFQYFARPSINQNGEMAFAAGVDSSPSTREGIWRYGANGTSVVVRPWSGFRSVGAPRSIGCRTIRDIRTLDEAIEGTGGGDGQPRQFNNAGVVAFLGWSQANQGGIYVAEPLDSIAATTPIIHLDFDEPYPYDFVIRTDRTPDDPRATLPAQTWFARRVSSPLVPLTTLNQSAREAIRQEMQKLLCDSNIDIPVTLQRPNRAQNVVTVHFTPLRPNVHCYRTGVPIEENSSVSRMGRLHGLSRLNDEGLWQPDQFNDEPTEKVFVNVDTVGTEAALCTHRPVVLDTPKRLASKALHEVGHTFGLAHINPYFSNNGLASGYRNEEEIMDNHYHEDVPERITNQDPYAPPPSFDMRIVDRFGDDGTAVNQTYFETRHNPMYHLRAYALNETRQAMETLGVMPGDWDLPPRINDEPQEIFVSLRGHEVLYNLALRLFGSFVPFLESDETAPKTIVRILGDFAGGTTGQFRIQLRPGTRFQLIGSSQADGAFDIYLQPTQNGSSAVFENFAAGVQYSGNIMRRRADDTWESIGTFSTQPPAPPTDTDGDTIVDAQDNCTTYPNTDQRDTDGDGFGNRCDGDFNNDGLVNVTDQNILKARFLTSDPHTDLNGDGTVNSLDLGLFKGLYQRPPGPSGLVN